MTTLLWFRRDLRLADNPALISALQSGLVIPVYIDDRQAQGAWPDGSASRWWLHHSLTALDLSLKSSGSRLIVRQGPSLRVLRELIHESKADRVCWNRRYEPAGIACDTQIKRELRADGVAVDTHNSALLYEPWEITRDGKQPYKVFTPFWKAMQARGLDLPVLALSESLPTVPATLESLPLASLELLPRIAWDSDFYLHWQPGEEGAWRKLESFCESSLADYKSLRDRPDCCGVSRLSAHLHFGEIGPRQIVRQLLGCGDFSAGSESYLRELGWREFAHHLLYHFPQTDETPLDGRFESFPWSKTDAVSLASWQKGGTGIPLVDAGMRELWQTG
jgi:deoxyribodipyrimidine photo-lyase